MSISKERLEEIKCTYGMEKRILAGKKWQEEYQEMLNAEHVRVADLSGNHEPSGNSGELNNG